MQHRLDFDVASSVTQQELRSRLRSSVPAGEWTGRESEYLGVYTMARFDNLAVVKIFQPNGGDQFEVEMAGPEDVPARWFEATKVQILEALNSSTQE